MEHTWKRAAFLAAATLVPLANAHAQFLSGNTITGCGGSTFVSCAGWSATASGNTLTFTIQNLSGSLATNTNSAFTEIGLGNIGSVYTLNTSAPGGGFTFVGDGSWSYDPNVQGFNGFNLMANTFGANSDPGDPAVNGLTDQETVTFTFVFNETIDVNDFLNPQVAVHDQGSLDECGGSSKSVWDGNTGELAFEGTDCGGGGNTIPEPSSMALLGTGLVGLVPLLRRRK